MASQIVVPLSSPTERAEAHKAVRALYKTSLSNYLRQCLRRARSEAEKQFPDLFATSALSQLRPIDRTIYRFLTMEGHRTLDDLIAETGLKRGGLKASLDRLIAADLVYTLAPVTNIVGTFDGLAMEPISDT
jgi:hypothetical protein